MTRLGVIQRGVPDPEEAAAFYGWLLDVEPMRDGIELRLRLANGALVLHGDTSVPVAIELSDAALDATDRDPDGVPVASNRRAPASDPSASAAIDHVRLNCADLTTTTDFYRRLGLGITWSGRSEATLDGPQDAPIDGADWLHVSSADGYLSLSQADWQDYGAHIAASGPPRFMHIGIAVRGLDDLVARLDREGISYLEGYPPVGRSIYVNDPDGDPRIGTNVELIEYLPDTARSGQHLATSTR